MPRSSNETTKLRSDSRSWVIFFERFGSAPSHVLIIETLAFGEEPMAKTQKMDIRKHLIFPKTLPILQLSSSYLKEPVGPVVYLRWKMRNSSQTQPSDICSLLTEQSEPGCRLQWPTAWTHHDISKEIRTSEAIDIWLCRHPPIPVLYSTAPLACVLLGLPAQQWQKKILPLCPIFFQRALLRYHVNSECEIHSVTFIKVVFMRDDNYI